MKTLFIVNPHSGRATRLLPDVQAFAATQGAEVRLTTGPRHATDLAAQALAHDAERIIAVGGDGTLNEVARVLVGRSAILGLVPCGSGNGLGRHLGIHGSFAHILDILRKGRPRMIDTGMVNGHPFFTVAGLGFEADISARFNRLQNRGFARYLSLSASALSEAKPQTYHINHEGRHTTVRAFTLAVANSDQYGNNARIAPAARVDDGLLDLTVVPPITALNALPLLARLFRGTLNLDPGVLRFRAASFIVERSSPGLVHTDGETHDAGTRLKFTVLPASLRILVATKK